MLHGGMLWPEMAVEITSLRGTPQRFGQPSDAVSQGVSIPIFFEMSSRMSFSDDSLAGVWKHRFPSLVWTETIARRRS